MNWKNMQLIALRSIMRNRMRSLLTSLGIVIGVCSVIVMVAIGQGSQRRIINEIASLGTNLLMVRPGTSRAGGISRGVGSQNRLTLDDADKIAKGSQYVKAVSPMINISAQVIGGGNNWNSSVNGVSADYLEIKDWDLESGEFFNDKDVQARKKVAILGKTVADELFPGQDPIGEKIRIQNTPFTVMGVLKQKGQSSFGMDADDVILVPSTTALYRLKGGTYINMIFVSAVSSKLMDAAEEEVSQLLRQAHRIRPGEDDDFSINNQTEIMAMASSIFKTLTLLLGAIAAVSLLVGGIGIMNIMLVSVTERTREIGIRLSVGARSFDILTQFLVEAVVLSLSGGLIGVLAAFGLTFILNTFVKMSTVIYPLTIFMAVTFAAAIGIFFGFYPARKASNLNPIDALRYE
ncbi:MAG TPA: ABC transporter permease [bacterium]